MQRNIGLRLNRDNNQLIFVPIVIFVLLYGSGRCLNNNNSQMMTVGFLLVAPIPMTHNIPLTDDDYHYRRHNHHHRLRSSQVDLPRTRLHVTKNSGSADRKSNKDNESMEEPPTTITTTATTTTTVNTRKEPELLQPFLPAADPNYMNIGDISNHVNNTFIVSRTGSPTIDELSNENMLKIVTGSTDQCTDLQINTLLWKCLGYRFNTTTQSWETSSDYCFPNWILKHPTPPDLIGMQRMYVFSYSILVHSIHFWCNKIKFVLILFFLFLRELFKQSLRNIKHIYYKDIHRQLIRSV